MRSLVVATLLAVLFAVPAAADYRRLPVPPADTITLGGGRLYVLLRSEPRRRLAGRAAPAGDLAAAHAADARLRHGVEPRPRRRRLPAPVLLPRGRRPLARGFRPLRRDADRRRAG